MSKQAATTVASYEDDSLINWKTQAWQDAGMVSWYSGRMVENTSTNYLKNALEVGTIKRHVRGKEILDIGIGTGRASLPLIEQGFHVTGIDSSQAMLNETRRLAGNMPITLQLGDITKLPFDEKSFDSAIALNVMVHFPNWREALLEWKRVVRPGGRIVFDIHSRDHFEAAYGADTNQWPAVMREAEDPSNFGRYMSRIRVDELVAFADQEGFAIMDAVPHGAFLGGGNINAFLYEPLEKTKRWTRVLSWFARDPHLLELGLFLEELLVARLTPKVAGRMFVVLENRADEAGNKAWAEEQRQKDAALGQQSFRALMPWMLLPSEDLSQELDRLLQPLRARHFFYCLLKTLVQRSPAYDFAGLLSEERVQQFSAWLAAEGLDQRVMGLVKGWSAGSREKFRHGVDLTLGADYHLVDTLLAKHYGIFGGNQG
ncbi:MULTISPECIES: class I SAM-dependent methyltransferase [Chromobacterium]|uniref:class I SAM-dependent methyltransferase n=1 Tax=Chromobacterium TaxID=535 RepID=UPI001D093684|nr:MULTISPECIES: methyltransferase domain-containing protein [Chromobacterium]MCP1290510.1 class I SAM-dependent methyltransferase [Chromobacterium sp. S0633]